MSITKRFVDLAKSNLNSLLEKAAETADPRRKLSNLSDAELEAELSRRRSAREGEAKVNAARARVDAVDPEPAKPPATAPGAAAGTPGAAGAPGASRPNGAASASSGASDREARERAARDREARVKAAREARERETRTQQEQAQAQARARAQQQAKASPRNGAAAAAGAAASAAAGAGAARKPPRGADPMVVQYYARLEVSYGAPWDEVKVAYRKLMRRYHPDLHAHSPEKLKAATEVAQALTQAYNELDKILNQ